RIDHLQRAGRCDLIINDAFSYKHHRLEKLYRLPFVDFGLHVTAKTLDLSAFDLTPRIFDFPAHGTNFERECLDSFAIGVWQRIGKLYGLERFIIPAKRKQGVGADFNEMVSLFRLQT